MNKNEMLTSAASFYIAASYLYGHVLLDIYECVCVWGGGGVVCVCVGVVWTYIGPDLHFLLYLYICRGMIHKLDAAMFRVNTDCFASEFSTPSVFHRVIYFVGKFRVRVFHEYLQLVHRVFYRWWENRLLPRRLLELVIFELRNVEEVQAVVEEEVYPMDLKLQVMLRNLMSGNSRGIRFY